MILGRVTRKKVCRPDAPSEIAASSSCVPCSCISGISARATKGNVTKMVARTMPGTANSTWMSCACSHGPQRPCAPNSSTNTKPEITGLTENGRSISVIRKRLSSELELGDRPRRDDAEHQIERHGDRGDKQRQPDRRERFRFGTAPRSTRRRLLQKPGRTRPPAAAPGTRRETAPPAPITTAHRAGSVWTSSGGEDGGFAAFQFRFGSMRRDARLRPSAAAG